MAKDIPAVKTERAHYLKGHASWLYCDHCNKTVAYLCYVTYRYFRFSFACACGSEGQVENQFGEVDLDSLPTCELTRNPVNKRYCCAQDDSALFSPVPKNLRRYEAEVVCRQCDARYRIAEDFSE